MEILALKNVHYKAKGTAILKNINMSVSKGDFITITGPSGSGKSTLLRLINALISPTSGEILYYGKNLSSYDPVELRRYINLCFQTPHLFGDTSYDNLSFPFHIRKAEVDSRLMEEKVRIFNLEKEILYKDIKNLSGGEKQRIALARSLMFKPDILLLDEVTSSLDESNTSVLENIISELNRESVTVLWITHNPLQADRLGNRRIHIENGSILEVGL